MIKRILVLALLAAAAACSSDSDPVDQPPDGYTRFRTPAVTVEPGESGLWVQWVSAPFESETDIADVVGNQTVAGHHALLYATPEEHPIGFTREWRNEDQLISRILGGVGGEGGATIPLPPGVVFRIPVGWSLFVQTHYINTTDETIHGEAVLDAKFIDPSPTAQVASWFFNASTSLDVLPGQSSAQVTCVLPEDVTLFIFGNHMHSLGSRAETHEVKSDGTSLDIQIDPVWQYEWATNPNFTFRTIQQPLVLSAGSTLTTDCTWENPGSETLGFPDEMCVFFGIRIGEGDIICADGSWII